MPIVTAEYSSLAAKQHDGMNILDYLLERFAYHSKDEWIEKINAGDVELNNKACSITDSIKKFNEVKYFVRNFNEPEIDTNVQIIFQNSDFLIAHKPAGMPVSRTGRIVYHTFIHTLRRLLNTEDIFLLHRLDKETSGLILCATNQDSCKKWQKYLNQMLLAKFYIALVDGNPEWTQNTCEQALGEIEGDEISSRMHPINDGKLCTTHFWKIATQNNKSLILCQLESGRKHQIRTHLSFLNHPIVGDKIYNHNGQFFLNQIQDQLSAENLATLESPHQLLHAYTVFTKLPDCEIKAFQSEILSDSWREQLLHFPNWQSQVDQKIEELGIAQSLGD
jgi:23S rRNA pseudouridine1911/1915/1917 synthase